ncbi:equilibrative nucleotide transporter 2-like isoform X1 [Arachis ipaensis]|uniref:equilibrative nucleotide transporter 2-like isoform X1 n=1 Tax=Arachis ipaensis TaxID=130454 RepID=UPI0007AF31AE|nr:equilibrative nucleotide transporter 2-like isoform X1 [Arachis ipaensis]XP_025683636.1 equilibrative nucleotide transporter 2 isoform X1 [Arachis hypogaea]QHN83126.1 Equilibrative nucleotide transporter [Arachis hypogaea]
MFSHQLPLPKFRNAKFPKFKLGILQARYPLVDFASSSPPPPSDTTTGDHHRLPSLSSFFSFFPIFPFLRSCVRHPCSWSHPLSASSSTDKQPPAAATFCATATSPPPHRLSFHQCRIDLATSGKGGIGTFIGICAVSGAFGIADAHVQGEMVGDLSYMHPELLQSFLAGGAASDALTSALRLVTKAAFENSKDGLRKGALLFFAITTFFELLCVILYAFVFSKVPIVKYYRSKAASEGAKTVLADLAAVVIQTSSVYSQSYQWFPYSRRRRAS